MKRLTLPTPARIAAGLGALAVALVQGCSSAYDDSTENRGPGAQLSDIPGHDGVGVDSRRVQGPRTMAAEVYLRSYMALFGSTSPEDVAELAAGNNGRNMFEGWREHLGAIGLPDYQQDIARAGETNTLMLGAYERLGMVLCARAAERDLRKSTERVVFDFALPADPMDRTAFDANFDSVHRTILGYPAKLAAARTDAFFHLYSTVVAHHGEAGVVSKLSPAEAGWASVCEGLVRHPEFHLY